MEKEYIRFKPVNVQLYLPGSLRNKRLGSTRIYKPAGTHGLVSESLYTPKRYTRTGYSKQTGPGTMYFKKPRVPYLDRDIPKNLPRGGSVMRVVDVGGEEESGNMDGSVIDPYRNIVQTSDSTSAPVVQAVAGNQSTIDQPTNQEISGPGEMANVNESSGNMDSRMDSPMDAEPSQPTQYEEIAPQSPQSVEVLNQIAAKIPDSQLMDIDNVTGDIYRGSQSFNQLVRISSAVGLDTADTVSLVSNERNNEASTSAVARRLSDAMVRNLKKPTTKNGDKLIKSIITGAKKQNLKTRDMFRQVMANINLNTTYIQNNNYVQNNYNQNASSENTGLTAGRPQIELAESTTESPTSPPVICMIQPESIAQRVKQNKRTVQKVYEDNEEDEETLAPKPKPKRTKKKQ